MNKKLFVILIVILLLAIVSIPTFAGPPEEVEGEWNYFVYDLEIKEAGKNTFMTTYDHGLWSGTFEGESTEVGMVVVHPSGKTSFNGSLSFDGNVKGESGTFEMSVVGQCCDEQGHWKGQWVILGGTDGLANLRGQGTWFGPGAGGPFVWGTVYYAGKSHFEP